MPTVQSKAVICTIPGFHLENCTRGGIPGNFDIKRGGGGGGAAARQL